MKKSILLIVTFLVSNIFLYAQQASTKQKQRQEIIDVVDQYQQAREKMDTILLKSILTDDVDQLVSTGEWRNGIQESVKGMLRSSSGNSGKRTLIVEKVKLLDARNAIADARYEIQNPDGTLRKMWSTFIAVYDKGKWKISAIRNMLPTEM